MFKHAATHALKLLTVLPLCGAIVGCGSFVSGGSVDRISDEQRKMKEDILQLQKKVIEIQTEADLARKLSSEAQRSAEAIEREFKAINDPSNKTTVIPTR